MTIIVGVYRTIEEKIACIWVSFCDMDHIKKKSGALEGQHNLTQARASLAGKVLGL
jgi:hypothetical protein